MSSRDFDKEIAALKAEQKLHGIKEDLSEIEAEISQLRKDNKKRLEGDEVVEKARDAEKKFFSSKLRSARTYRDKLVGLVDGSAEQDRQEGDASEAGESTDEVGDSHTNDDDSSGRHWGEQDASDGDENTGESVSNFLQRTRQ